MVGDIVRSSRSLAVPPRPVIDSGEMYQSGLPFPLIDGLRRTLGWQWQPEGKGGSGFVIIGRGALGGYKIIERFPLTDAGWQTAWEALVLADPAAAQRVTDALAARISKSQERRQTASGELADLDLRSLTVLVNVALLGGYGPSADIIIGQRYDVRFLAESLAVCLHRHATVQLELPYTDVEDVEIGGPGVVRTGGRFVGGGFGAVGALQGMAVAAVLNALTTKTTTTTVMRVQARGCELFLLDNTLTPQRLRMAISRPLAAIRDARPSSAVPVPASPVEELSKLASMLENGLLTREEFDALKARLLGSP